jgi:hypothetical protein
MGVVAAGRGGNKSPSAKTNNDAANHVATSPSTTSTQPERDSLDDPYISEAQARRIKVGMAATAAFRALGGKSPSGYNGIQAVPPLSYDYPISGTGSGDAADPVNESYTWFQVCVKDNRVIGMARGTLDSLGEQC